MIKENLFEALVQQSSSPLIRVQLLECFKPIIKIDWPQQWPTLLPAVLSSLSSPSPSRVYSALLVLSALYKRWTFVDPKRRDVPVDTLTQDAFPHLLPVLQSLSQLDTVEAHEMLRVACRVLFLATQMRVAPYLRSANTALPFFTLLIHTVSRPLPAAAIAHFTSSTGLPPSSYPLCKAQRWALNALTRVFGRWGQPLAVKDKGLKAFASFFSAKVALPTFSAVVGVLRAARSGVWVSPRVLQLCYVWLSYALKLQSLRRLMQTNLEFLVQDGILPVLCLTPDDVALFVNDPHEFIRQSLDLMEEYHDPRVSACNFLIDLVTVDVRRKSNEALSIAFAVIARVFRNHALQPTAEASIIVKEGAMRMLGALRQVVMKDEALHATVESLLVSAVLPELSSPHGFGPLSRHQPPRPVQQAAVDGQGPPGGGHRPHLPVPAAAQRAAGATGGRGGHQPAVEGRARDGVPAAADPHDLRHLLRPHGRDRQRGGHQHAAGAARPGGRGRRAVRR